MARLELLGHYAIDTDSRPQGAGEFAISMGDAQEGACTAVSGSPSDTVQHNHVCSSLRELIIRCAYRIAPPVEPRTAGPTMRNRVRAAPGKGE